MTNPNNSNCGNKDPGKGESKPGVEIHLGSSRDQCTPHHVLRFLYPTKPGLAYIPAHEYIHDHTDDEICALG